MNSFFQTIVNLFKKPVTVPYPAVNTFKPSDYRGLIEFNEDLCIWCRRCEAVCPPGAIVFSQDIKDGKQEYHYSPYVCIYCHECVRVCPKPGAILQSNEPGHPGLKEQNVNNGWNTLFADALQSREDYAAEKKRQKAEADALKKAAAAATVVAPPENGKSAN